MKGSRESSETCVPSAGGDVRDAGVGCWRGDTGVEIELERVFPEVELEVQAAGLGLISHGSGLLRKANFKHLP